MHRTRAAGLLIFFSVMLLLEGVFRAATSIAGYSSGVASSFPLSALVAGGVCQVAMGLAGVFLAGAVLSGVTVTSFAVMAVFGFELLVGWFIFLLFVIVNPGMEAAAVQGIPFPWTSRYDFNVFVAMGILASTGYCITLLGGQMDFTLTLYFLTKSGAPYVPSEKSYTMRGVFYSAVTCLTGVFLLVGGCEAMKILPGPVNVVAPPIFVVWPQIYLATGALAIVVGLAGIGCAFANPSLSFAALVAVLHVVNCVWQIAVMALYSAPVLGFPNPTTAIAGLILSQLAPAYFYLIRVTSFHRATRKSASGKALDVDIGEGVKLN